jgi:acetoacetyl-CoA synthetase
MGTSEIYRAVLENEEVTDALVVDLPRPVTDGRMALFCTLRDGVHETLRTISGKVLEVPVKRILMGALVDKAALTAAPRHRSI